MKFHGQKWIKNKWQLEFKRKIERLHSWIFNHPQVVNSPLTNDHVNIKDNSAGEIIKAKSYLLK